MSDKGDIDVGLALHLTRCISNKHDDIRHDIGLIIMQELRSHGWINLDDVVVGKVITEDCDGYEGCAIDCHQCAVKEREGRPDMMLTMTKDRPATVKDLIG